MAAAVSAATMMGSVAGVLAAEPFKIGLILPYTGIFASISEDETRGFEIALDEFGREVAGRKIELYKGDSELKPPIALQQANKLISQDGVDIIVGGSSSSEAFALRGALLPRKMPFVIIQAAANELTRELCDPLLVRTSFNAYAFESAFGPWLAANAGKKAFTIAPDYSAGHQIIESFAAGFKEAGGEIVGQAWTRFRETRDFGPFLGQAKESGADFIYVFFGGAESIQFITQHASFGLKDSLPVYGNQWVYGGNILKAQGDAAVDGKFITLYMTDIDTPENKAFVAEYEKRHGVLPTMDSVFGYDAAKAVLLGLQKRLGPEGQPRILDPALGRAIGSVSYKSPRGAYRIDPATQNVVNEDLYVGVVEKKDGELVHRMLDKIKGAADPGTGCKLGG